MSTEFTDSNFQAEVLEAQQPVVVDFSAAWCGPCKQLSPIIDDLAKEYEGQVKVGKVDIDQSQEVGPHRPLLQRGRKSGYLGRAQREKRLQGQDRRPGRVTALADGRKEADSLR